MSKSKFIEFAGYAPDRAHEGPQYLRMAHQMLPLKSGLVRFPAWARNTSFPTASSLGTVVRQGAVLFPLYDAPAEAASTIYIVARTDNTAYTCTVHKGAVFFGQTVDVTPSAASYLTDDRSQTQIVGFGAFTLMYNVARLYAHTASSNNPFIEVSGFPVADIHRCVVIAKNFVVALGGGTARDVWHCSARDDHASWTLNPATLCTRGRLTDSAGSIVAGVEYNGDIIAFKQNAMYRGRFVPGSVEVWEWEKLPFDIALPPGNSYPVCRTPNGVVFFNSDGLYLYDGAQIVCITPHMRDAFLYYNRSAQNSGNDFNPSLGMGLIFFVMTNGYIQYWPMADLLVGQVRLSRTSEYMCNAGFALNMTTRKLTTFMQKTGNMEEYPYYPTTIISTKTDATVSTAGTVTKLVLSYGRQKRTEYPVTTSEYLDAGELTDLYGAPTTPRIITGDVYDDFADTEITEIRLRHLEPGLGTITATHMMRETQRDTFQTGDALPEDRNKFEVRGIAKGHAFQFDFPALVTGTSFNNEILGMRVVMENVGETGED